MTPLVGYHVRTPAGIPANVGGVAYDYLVGAGGVYIAAENAVLDATITVAAADIRGLTEVHPGFELKPGRIPEVIWWAIHDICTDAARRGHEVLCEVVHTMAGYQLARPRQITSGVAVRYEPSDGCVLQLHSHHRMPAYFSHTDDADEQGLCLYGVLGRLGCPPRQEEVLLRIGVYGYYAAVPWELVFAGELGTVHDLARGCPRRESNDMDQDQQEQEELAR